MPRKTKIRRVKAVEVVMKRLHITLLSKMMIDLKEDKGTIVEEVLTVAEDHLLKKRDQLRVAT